MKRSLKHINLEYSLSKLFSFYDNFLNPNNPWLTKDSVKILSSMLKTQDKGVEFGSGRSTIWFAKKIKHLISIEHDPKWHNKVRKLIDSESLSEKVDYYLKESESDYANACDLIENESIDFCLIDGIFRDQCTLKMLPKIKKGGILILDNINWYFPNEKTKSPSSRRIKDGYESKIWLNVWNQIKEWRIIWTSNGITDTAIFIKICK